MLNILCLKTKERLFLYKRILKNFSFKEIHSFNVVFFLLAVFLSFFHNTSLAVAPTPDLVYRLDTRDPDVIFNEGFIPMGDNNNLIAHLSGRALEEGNSAFVSTTSTWSAIERFAIEDMEPDENRWVYEITPTYTFYDVNGSMIHANMQNPDTPLASQALRIFQSFSWQEEFVSFGQINSSHIHYAYRIGIENNEVAVLEVRENHHYIPSPPTINPNYYTNLVAENPAIAEVIFDDDSDYEDFFAPVFPAGRGFFPDFNGACGSYLEKKVEKGKMICRKIRISLLDTVFFQKSLLLLL